MCVSFYSFTPVLHLHLHLHTQTNKQMDTYDKRIQTLQDDLHDKVTILARKEASLGNLEKQAATLDTERKEAQENIYRLGEEVRKMKEENTKLQGQLEKANSNVRFLWAF